MSELSYEHKIVGSNRKIDPTRRAHLKADLTPDDNDRVEIGMALSVEAYVRAVDGHEGVKLEEQIVVTDNGVVPLSSYRFEAAMLA